MTEPQGLSKRQLFEEKTYDYQRSILLVDIMNVIGFSKCEREIHIHAIHFKNVLMNISQANDNETANIFTGSISEGMCGGIYSNKSHHDFDMLFTLRNIKLYTPRTKKILTTIHFYPYMTMKIMMHLFLSKKMTTFQDM